MAPQIQGVTPGAMRGYNEACMLPGHKPDCWLHSLVCPRRYRAVLPALVRANLFAGD